MRSVSASCSYNQGCSGKYGSTMPSRRCTSASFFAESGTNSANAWRSCMPLSQGARSARRTTVSSLFAIRKTGLPASMSARTLASSSPKRPASTTNSTTSTSPSTPVTVRFSVRFSAAACLVWKPGVSTNTNCESEAVRMPVMRCRVVCAFADVMLTFWPTSAFSKVDLPTFGRPTIATRPQCCAAGAGAGASEAASTSVVMISSSRGIDRCTYRARGCHRSGLQRAAGLVAALQGIEHAARSLLLGNTPRAADTLFHQA